MRRMFGLLALAAATLGVWVLFAGPGAEPPGSGGRALSEAPIAYTAWAVGLLTGLTLAWLAAKDSRRLPEWLRRQRGRLGLLILGGLLASALFLL